MMEDKHREMQIEMIQSRSRLLQKDVSILISLTPTTICRNHLADASIFLDKVSESLNNARIEHDKI